MPGPVTGSRPGPLLGPLNTLGDAPTRPRLLAALRRVYLLGLAALALPGVLIGLPVGLLSRSQPGIPVMLGLGVAAVLCAALALTLAHRRARPALRGTPEGRSLAVQAAIQAASAPAAPLLMALAMVNTPATLLALFGLTLLALAAGWWSLGLWASRVGVSAPVQDTVSVQDTVTLEGAALSASARSSRV